jgi:uncharacterized protein YciI
MPLARLALTLWLLLAAAGPLRAQTPPAEPPVHDPGLAQRYGADARGMRSYVLVVLRTGPVKVPAGPERDAMFRGHFANINRLAAEGKLVLAGPFDGVDGWRGLFIFATTDLEQAKAWVATDPVVEKGEMVPELHRYYGSAALMAVNELHPRLVPPPPLKP